jgi:hypothetical protein
MTTQLTELVRDSLDQLTDGATVPADLAARARHRARRRTTITRAGSATAVVTCAAVLATLIATGNPSGTARPTGAALTAYVVSRTSRALAAASASEVSEATTPLANGGESISWSGPRGSKLETLAAGMPVLASGGRHGLSMLIDYRRRIWNQGPMPPGSDYGSLPAGFLRQMLRGTPGCRPVPGVSPGSWSPYLRALLTCHALRVAGTGRVDGAAAIRLVPAPRMHIVYPWISAVVWVSSSSYLPLRLIAVAPKSGPLKSAGSEIDVRWLPATAANLAKTRMPPPPAGFRKLAWFQAPPPGHRVKKG